MNRQKSHRCSSSDGSLFYIVLNYSSTAAARQINPIIERFGGTPIALNGDCWYWTSTEVTENAGLQAWLCSAVNGGILPTPKTESHKARAVVEIHYPE